jgi:hypothetical protein
MRRGIAFNGHEGVEDIRITIVLEGERSFQGTRRTPLAALGRAVPHVLFYATAPRPDR